MSLMVRRSFFVFCFQIVLLSCSNNETLVNVPPDKVRIDTVLFFDIMKAEFDTDITKNIFKYNVALKRYDSSQIFIKKIIVDTLHISEKRDSFLLQERTIKYNFSKMTYDTIKSKPSYSLSPVD